MAAIHTKFRLYNPDTDAYLPWYDHSGGNNIATCPTFGIIRSVFHKTFADSGRAMALEAGSAAHEFFAAARLYTLGHIQNEQELMHVHGRALFGETRWFGIYSHFDAEGQANGALDALYTSGFYDDPIDNRRTMANIEASCLSWLDNYYVPTQEDNPVWFSGDLVGIEMPIQYVVEWYNNNGELVARVVYKGLADAVHVMRSGAATLRDEKTTSRLTDATPIAHAIAHQSTGYWVGLSLIPELSDLSRRMRYTYTQIPPPSGSRSGIHSQPIEITDHKIETFSHWLFQQHKTRMKYDDEPWKAERRTNSCFRYNRPCSFATRFCNFNYEEAQHIFENQMVIDKFDPTEAGVKDYE